MSFTFSSILIDGMLCFSRRRSNYNEWYQACELQVPRPLAEGRKGSQGLVPSRPSRTPPGEILSAVAGSCHSEGEGESSPALTTVPSEFSVLSSSS